MAVSNALLRAVLDGIPAPLFVVTEDYVVQDCNQAAAALLLRETMATPESLQRLCGQVVSCAHVSDHPGGCGHGPACPQCALRNSVRSAAYGQNVVRRYARMLLRIGGENQEVSMLISASRLPALKLDGQASVLVMIEDVSELAELRRLIPVCAHCGRVREADLYRQSVQDYLTRNTVVQFSHSLCPDCLRELYPDLVSQAEPEETAEPSDPENTPR